MQNFEIEIINGVQAGRVIPISVQPIVFGRTEIADVVIDWDSLSSSRHFQLQIDEGQLLLMDLKSTNGTFVNGERVQTARLRDRDLVVAGNTRFTVRAPEKSLPDAVPRQSSQESAPPASFDPYQSYRGAAPKEVAKKTDTVAEKAQRPGVLEATQSRCASGLVRLQGRIPEGRTMVDIIHSLCKVESFYLTMDFGRLAEQPPAEVDVAASCLFDWLPAAAAVQTPQLVATSECSDWTTWIEDGWGSNLIVGLQSSLEKSNLVDKLRQLVRGPGSSGDASRGISGFCWPVVLVPLLANDTDGFATQLMESIDLALVETQEPVGGWQLFARDPVVETLRGKGLKVLQAETDDSGSSQPKA